MGNVLLCTSELQNTLNNWTKLKKRHVSILNCDKITGYNDNNYPIKVSLLFMAPTSSSAIPAPP